MCVCVRECACACACVRLNAEFKLRTSVSFESFHCCGEPCFAGAAILRRRCQSLIFRRGKHESLQI
jgi:hypothetical protein